MKHYILYTAALTFLAIPAMAQETYESANIATQDLNGTARYVGMGGAMEALGADISTISTNPAGIGLFRKSGISFSMGATSVKGDDTSVADKLNITGKKTPMSFDQIGFVYANETSRGNFVNCAFNYHKSRNFNQILSHMSSLNGASLNKLSYQKGMIGDARNGGFYADFNEDDDLIGYYSELSPVTSQCFSQVDYLMWNAFLVDPKDGNAYYYDGYDYLFARNQKGYISNYDFNVSGNHNDRIYWGITFGIKDVKYKHNQVYSEDINDIKGNAAGYIDMVDKREITGQGYDIKAGIIFRPIDASPLRIGLSVSTPTWYELKSYNNTKILNNGYDENLKQNIGFEGDYYTSDEYKYKVFTPWKFGASIGYTIGKEIALGASYEYADYSSLDNRNITGVDYNYDGSTTSASKSDMKMNSHTEKSLCGVSTLKLGAEYKPMPELSIRAGYNYVSQMYDDKAERTTMINVDSCYFSSTTDFVNWKATNRFTLGVGFNIDDFNIDVAYQRSMQKGDFHPFEAISVDGNLNKAPVVEVNNNRDQFLITLGYKF